MAEPELTPTPTPLTPMRMAPTMPAPAQAGGFDVEAARRDGKSDDEIIQYLSQTRGFDVATALKDGHSKADIVAHMATMKPKAPGFSLGNVLGEWWKGVNPIEGAKGTLQMARHPIEAIRADAAQRAAMMDPAAAALERKDYPTLARKWLEASVPFVGPMLAPAGDFGQSGELDKMIGSTAGLATNLIAPELVKGVAPRIGRLADSVSEGLSRSSLGATGRYARPEIKAFTKTMRAEGIPVSARGAEKLSRLIKELGEAGDADVAANPKLPISPGPAVTRLGEMRKGFEEQVLGKSDLGIIDSAQEEFLDKFRTGPGKAVRNLTAAEGQAMKKGTYRQLASKAFGEVGSVSEKSQVQLAGGIGDELAEHFPELASKNARLGPLLDLRKPLETAVKNLEKRHALGIHASVFGTGVGLVTSDLKLGVAAAVMKQVLEHPGIKSYLAIAISKASKWKVPYPVAMARVVGYANALGQGQEGQDAAQVGK
jgi:hypothetical protein